MKKCFYIFFIFFISCFSLLVFDFKVNGASSDAYLIMTNPSEDSNTSMTITWHTLVEGTYVEYTKNEDTDFSESTKVNGIYEQLKIYDGTTNGEITDFKCYAKLENLSKDTKYIYRVGKDNMSEIHSFKTGGVEDFNFAVVSDIHVYSKIASRLSTADSMIKDFNQKKELSFVLSVGDTMAYGTHRGYWDDLCESSIIKNQMFAATPGNHDYYNGSADFLDASYFNAYTKNPDNGPEGMKNTAYYFYYNDVMFISLNSEDACTNTTKKQTQRVWLENVLENNTANFIVVYFHRSMYPGSGGNNGHATKMKDAYQDLFDKYGVDLVFGGHDHVYVRTAKIINGKTSASSTFGTTYISLPQIGDRVNGANSDMTDVIKKYGSISGGLLFTATKDSLSFDLYNEKGERLDGGTVFSKMSSIEQKKLERETTISYNETFSNMSLDIYPVLFQRAVNIKVYDNEELVLDFRPEYNKTNYPIAGVTDLMLQKNYKLLITYRDGTTYEKEFFVENKDLDITFNAADVVCNVNDEIEIEITNSLNVDFEYTYRFDDEYVKIVDGKLYAIKAGNTKIYASTNDILDAVEINITIKEELVNIQYYLDGGVLENQVTQLIKGEQLILGTPTKEGYNFLGWYLDDTFTQKYESLNVDSDINLYAKWEKVDSGCNSAAILYTSLMFLGLVLLRRKKM